MHYRDFPVGDAIADTIVESVQASKRTIILLSNNFVDSEWCRFEFRAAHQHVLREGGHRLIIVVLEDVAEERLDADLKVTVLLSLAALLRLVRPLVRCRLSSLWDLKE